jgi:hypothetical protein
LPDGLVNYWLLVQSTVGKPGNFRTLIMRKLLKEYITLGSYAATKEQLSRLQGLLILMVFTCVVILIMLL